MAFSRGMRMRSSGMVMAGTTRWRGTLRIGGRATGAINNGMQPRRTRWKEKLPANKQPRQDLSAMRKHALWAMEDRDRKLRARPVLVNVTESTPFQR